MTGSGFLIDVERLSQEKISICYQCYRCSAGCPVADEMDILPHRIIRYIILGEKDKVLGSKTLWRCLQCSTCSVRCPNDIDVARIIDTIRKMAIDENMASERDQWIFDELFVESIGRHGRMNELGTILRYKIKKGDLFGDAKMGFGMFLKGRIGLLPHNTKDRKALRTMIERIKNKRK